MEHPRLGSIRAVRNPVLFDTDGPTIRKAAPLLGEHSAEILAELGYTDSQIEELACAGAVVMAPVP